MRPIVIGVMIATMFPILHASATTGAVDATEGHQYMVAYAHCVVQRDHNRAAAAVLANLSQRDLERNYSDIFLAQPVVFVARCQRLVMRADVAFRYSGEPLLSALAEALIESDLQYANPIELSDRLPLMYSTPLREKVSTARHEGTGRHSSNIQQPEEESARQWLSRYGECIVRSQPTLARNWVRTVTDGADEAATIRALSPALSECLVEGQEMRFAKSRLRGAVAINYFRLAMAKPGPATGVVH